jgi:hypothetical protein
MLIVHICAGTLGLLTGTAALSFRKGSRPHVLAGRIFVASMLTMAAAAVYLAIVRHQPNNIGGGILTFYLIGTAWLTARRRGGETSPFDWIALLIPLAIGILAWKNGLDALRSPAGEKYGSRAECTFLWVPCACLLPQETFACWCVAGLLEHSVSRGTSGACALDCLSQQGLFSLDRRTVL